MELGLITQETFTEDIIFLIRKRKIIRKARKHDLSLFERTNKKKTDGLFSAANLAILGLDLALFMLFQPLKKHFFFQFVRLKKSLQIIVRLWVISAVRL